MKKLLLVLTIFGALAACETTEQAMRKEGKKSLTAAQIHQTLIGNTLVGTHNSGVSFTGIYRKDGRFKFVVYQHPRFNRDVVMTGAWRITKAGTNCTIKDQPEYGDGRTGCNRYYKVGRNEYQSVKPDGSAQSRFKIIRGNPKKL